jgi:cytochrome c553
MQEVGQRLAAPEIAALAAHLGSLPATPGQQQTATPPAAEALAAAGQLAVAGDAARGIPACSACHGDSGLALAPRLDGQGRTYLERRLSAFAEGRDAASWSPMRLIASSLSGEERRALADYFATR